MLNFLFKRLRGLTGKKEIIDLPCPNVVIQYNKHMGGVDLLWTAMLEDTKIKCDKKKFYFRIFYHLLDVSIINAWLLFKRIRAADVTLAQFREEEAVF